MAELAALHLDHQFGPASDWAVLHDLRLRMDGHLLHLDHLLINDFLMCVCIDSRYLTRHVSRAGEGRFSVSSSVEGPLPIGSVLARSARQARLMVSLVERRRGLRRRLGRHLRSGPLVQARGLVLHDASLICEPTRTVPSAGSALAGTEALQALLQQQRRGRGQRPFERVPATVLHAMATRIADHHRPNDDGSMVERPRSMTGDSDRHVRVAF